MLNLPVAKTTAYLQFMAKHKINWPVVICLEEEFSNNQIKI